MRKGLTSCSLAVDRSYLDDAFQTPIQRIDLLQDLFKGLSRAN